VIRVASHIRAETWNKPKQRLWKYTRQPAARGAQGAHEHVPPLFARRKANVTWSLVVEVGPQQMAVDKEFSGGRVLELRADANGIAMEGIVAS